MTTLNSVLEKKEEALSWLEKALQLQKIPFFIYQMFLEQSGSVYINIINTQEYRTLMEKYFPDEWKE